MPEIADGEPGRRPHHVYFEGSSFSVEKTSQEQDSVTSSYSNQAPATITASPVSIAAHRTETMTSTQEPSNDCALDLSTKVVEDIRPHLLPEDPISRVSTPAKRTLTESEESEDPFRPPQKKVTKAVRDSSKQRATILFKLSCSQQPV